MIFCQSGKMNVAVVVSTKAREVEMKFITIHSLELYIRKVFIKIPTVYNLYCGLIVFNIDFTLCRRFYRLRRQGQVRYKRGRLVFHQDLRSKP